MKKRGGSRCLKVKRELKLGHFGRLSCMLLSALKSGTCKFSGVSSCQISTTLTEQSAVMFNHNGLGVFGG